MKQHSTEQEKKKVKEIKRRNVWSLFIFILLVLACFTVRILYPTAFSSEEETTVPTTITDTPKK